MAAPADRAADTADNSADKEVEDSADNLANTAAHSAENNSNRIADKPVADWTDWFGQFDLPDSSGRLACRRRGRNWHQTESRNVNKRS